MLLETTHFYDFDGFRLDLGEKVLLREGKVVPLTPKVFDTLQVLLENAGRLIGKDELMEKVWHERFVEESNLTFNIKMLRKALDDDATHPRFIETVPRRGYRFIADVRPFIPEKTAAESGAAKRADGQKKPRTSAAVVIVIGAAGLALGAWYASAHIFGSITQPPILATKFASEKITRSGNVEVAAISPDGKYAAYVDAIGGMQSVWMRQIESGENIQIIKPAEETYLSLTFSRDGNSLFFVRKPNEGLSIPALYRVTALGGVPVKILDDALRFVSLTPDDKRLSFVRCAYKPDDFCGLLVADADGRNERRLITRPQSIHLYDNRFSPDGKVIAYASGNRFNGSSNVRLFEIDVETGVERQIATRTFFDIKCLDWLPDGSGLIISAKEFLDGKVSLWHISRSSGEANRLADDPNSYFIVSLSRNADRMLSTQVSNNYRLFYQPAGAAEKTLAAARDFAFGPDGRIVYASDDRNIWEIQPDGTGQRQLTSDPATDFSPHVSPDGRYIYFTSNRTGENQVWRMDSDGVNQIQITKNEGGYPRHISADGKWVFYLSGKTDRLWKVSIETGEEIEIVPKKLFSPAISPDGKFVAHFIRDPDFKIGILRLEDQQLTKAIDHGDGKSFSFVVDWSPDGRSLYFVAKSDDRNILWQQSLDSDKPEMIADLGGEDIERFVLAPDGESYAFTRGKWMHDAVLIKGLE